MTDKIIAAELRKNGIKLTQQRRAIIEVISSCREHLTPADIFERVKGKNKGIGLVTVYRTLEMLHEQGLLCEVHIGDSCRSYLTRAGGHHHHHLVCENCGTVVDFSDCKLDDLEDRLVSTTGFTINRHLLEFMGLCSKCQRAEG